MNTRRSRSKTTKTLEKLSFKQTELIEQAMEIHDLLEAAEAQPHHEYLGLFLDWFLIAHTLRPADFKRVARYVCQLIKEGKPLPPQIIAAMENYRSLPPKEIQRHIIMTERRVARGKYERYVSKAGQAKYRAAVRKMRKDPELEKALEEFRARNPEFCAAKKVRRRTMSMERNFKPDEFYFKDATPERLAWLEFDSLCYRFNLFGLEDFGHTALLQKLTVNATPHGIMIFIPRYWSFDYKRDLNWKEINVLLKSWGIPKQGQTLSETRLATDQKYKMAFIYYQRAGKDGLEGDERIQFALTKARLRPNMDRGSFFRITRRGKKLYEAEKARKKK